jgi:hypothetical protein
MLENLQKIYNLDSSDYSIDVNEKPINLDITESELKSEKEENTSAIENPSTVSRENELASNSETIFSDLKIETAPQILLSEEIKPETDSNPNSLQKQTNNFDLNNNFGWLSDRSTDLTDATHLLICNCTVCQGQSFIENTTSLSQSQIAATTTTTTYSLNSLPVLSSNPNATAKIYLDFNGHTTTETLWNSWVASDKNIITPAYSIDTDTTTFNDAELTAIEQIWQRVAEDYAPFNIDVTTVAPTNYSAKTAVRVAIGGSSSDWYGNGAGGVAFVGSWTWGEDTPAFVFENNLGNGNVKNTAEAISHEVGHTLGLKHQSTYDATGKRTQDYSTGSGSGETSWAPIMGVGYSKNLTTWHNGANSNSSTSYQDDMAIISSSGNGFGYRQDDYGNSISTAKVLSGVTQLSASGIITTTADVDVFRFSTGTGNVNFDIKGASLGQNLDVVAKLLDSNGSVILTSDLSDKINANISKSLNAGTYYLQVGSNGKYGRVGQYTVAGTLPQAVAEVAPEVSINDVRITEGQSSNLASFTVSLSKAATSAVSVDFATFNGTAFSIEDYLAKTGTIDFATGETSRTITVQVNDDSLIEAEETFSLKLSNANGLTIKDDFGVGTIVSNDVFIVPEVSINDVRITEGQSSNLASFTVSLSKAATSAVSVNFATFNGTAFIVEDYVAKTGTISFTTGETSKTITVQINDDSLIEAEETFGLKLSNANGLTIADDFGVGTIVSNDINNTSTIDTLQGTTSTDLFILGDISEVYYNDNGNADYALITGFQGGRDVIQLYGSAADYSVTPSSNGLPEGMAIYDDSNDLIGIVKGYSSLGKGAFRFV